MEHIIRKKDGSWVNVLAMKQHWDSLPDGNYEVRIRSTKQRSNDQNSYYHGIVVPLVFQGLREAGFDSVRHKEDAHEVMKSLFLKVKEDKGGLVVERVMSTTELTTIGFAEYLMKIFQWAAEYLGVVIPEPDQQLEFQL